MNSSTPLYLDTAATVRMHPDAVAAVTEAMREDWANPSSPHLPGRRAAGAVADARKMIAELLGTTPGRIVFTSGATESLNTAIKSCATARPGARIVIGSTEHKAALAAANAVADVAVVPVDSQGRVDLEAAERLVSEGPCSALVLMAVNNETGVLTDSSRVADIGRRHDVPTIVDATQQLWRVPMDVDAQGLDYVTVSAHKIGGPKGVGALVTPADKRAVTPLLHGGDHEAGLRSGTINTPGIRGFAAAAAAVDHVPGLEARTQELYQRLADALGSRTVHWHGDAADRAPGFLNVQIDGVDADALVAGTPSVAFATGSACQSDTPTPSHVLLAMGKTREQADQSVRFTPDPALTQVELGKAADAIIQTAQRLREMAA